MTAPLVAPAREFTPEDAEWVRSHCEAIDRVFRERFVAVGAIFPGANKLLRRLANDRVGVLRHGWGHWHFVEETHNELCVATALLFDVGTIKRLDYEPRLPNTGLRIDFRVIREDGTAVYVDVKTIAPRRSDDWEKFEHVVINDRLPANIEVILEKDWLGGELWHNMFSARARMLEHTLKLEEKLTRANIAAATVPVMLMFCGTGFHWHLDELEDFADFYRTGVHRGDDPHSKMEKHRIQSEGLDLARSLTLFGHLERGSGELKPRRIVWTVTPPPIPW